MTRYIPDVVKLVRILQAIAILCQVYSRASGCEPGVVRYVSDRELYSLASTGTVPLTLAHMHQPVHYPPRPLVQYLRRVAQTAGIPADIYKTGTNLLRRSRLGGGIRAYLSMPGQVPDLQPCPWYVWSCLTRHSQILQVLLMAIPPFYRVRWHILSHTQDLHPKPVYVASSLISPKTLKGNGK
ncbi:hypothetical protein K439DRAFT_955483 [Ramaria rubella]|nr:hypothetical protein K439DRAFT_955483 [Ramaria rubella]